jgi:hypothetical protein
MTDKGQIVNAKRVLTIDVTIPVLSTPATVWSLVSAVFGTLEIHDVQVRFWRILPQVADGTARGAIRYGHAAAEVNGHCAAEIALEQSTTDLSATWVCGNTEATVAAVLEISVD